MPTITQKSQNLLSRAQKVIPGGVNSPVRAFKAVGGEPLFIVSADGAYVTDVDGNRYIDYVGSWGPMILGHNASCVREALEQVLKNGTSFGAPTELEVNFAEYLISILPGLDSIRMVNSGTEATMSALRLARGYTKRDYLIKFEGCYHGHGDSFLVKAGSGIATFGIPGSSGVPESLAELTLTVPFNDLAALEEKLAQVGGEKVAAIILEPVPGNMGLILPEAGFLSALRELCDKHGIVLIFDEVMTGFRLALGGASERFDVRADLYTYGKVIGGGLPVGAFGGRKEIMDYLAPVGPVYQAGTLSGNPLAMAAGFAAVKELKDSNPYPKLEELGSLWVQGMKKAAVEAKIDLVASNCGSMLGLFFTKNPVRNFEDVKKTDIARFNKFFHGMLEEGVYLAPSAFEAGFISTAHSEEIIEKTIKAARRVFAKLYL